MLFDLGFRLHLEQFELVLHLLLGQVSPAGHGQMVLQLLDLQGGVALLLLQLLLLEQKHLLAHLQVRHWVLDLLHWFLLLVPKVLLDALLLDVNHRLVLRCFYDYFLSP